MRSKKPFSAGESTFVIFITLLLASAIVPTQAQAQTFKVLHTFHGKDGWVPASQLVIDSAGNIYGTTAAGGSGTCTPGPGCGTVFKLNKYGKLLWSHSFHGKDGWDPSAGVFRDSAGNLFGTTVVGGKVTNACGGAPEGGCGVVFKLDGSGKQTLLYLFAGSPNGWAPEALLVEDTAANLYGTTIYGGALHPDGGTVFKVNQAGRETVLISFPGPPGQARPGPGVILRGNKNLYGVTEDGGSGGGAGTVFRLSTGGNQTILYDFMGGSDGQGPNSILAADSAGNLYGTTVDGGGSNCIVGNCGTVFELSPHTGGWTHKTLYAFCQLSLCADGWDPLFGPLIIDSAGNIYGTAHVGGNSGCNKLGCGVVFKLDASGQETVLHTFTGGADGANPWAGLTMDAAGNLYGTAGSGGDLNCQTKYGGCGVVFKITPCTRQALDSHRTFSVTWPDLQRALGLSRRRLRGALWHAPEARLGGENEESSFLYCSAVVVACIGHDLASSIQGYMERKRSYLCGQLQFISHAGQPDRCLGLMGDRCCEQCHC